MKITDLPLAPTALIELEVHSGPIPDVCVAGATITLMPRTGGLRLCFPEQPALHLDVKPATDGEAHKIQLLLVSPWPKLCAIASRTGDRSVAIVAFEFTAVHHWPESQELAIGVDSTLRQQVSGIIRQPGASPDALFDWFRTTFVVPPAKQGFPSHLILAIPDAAPGSEPSWDLCGTALTATLQKAGNDKLRMTTLASVDRTPRRYILFEAASIRFGELSAVPPLSALANGLLAQLSAGTEQYLRLWTEYARLEEGRLDRLAEAIGSIAYDAVEARGQKQLRFILSFADDDDLAPLRTALAECSDDQTITLEAAADVPHHLKRPDRTSPASSGQARQGRSPVLGRRALTSGRGLCGPDDVDRRGTSITLRDCKGQPPRRGFLFLSQTGERVQISKRREAQTGIQNSACPMPQLGLLLEGQPLPFRAARSTANHMTHRVRAEFANAPSIAQQVAVNVAVNTPDIALIQGPPGTGKTQVIAAIVKRLEEMAEAGQHDGRLFLISSHQHVAVENVMERIQPFGLPAVKLGRSPSSSGPVRSTQTWIDDLCAQLAALRDADKSDLSEFRELRTIRQTYLSGPHRFDDAASMLETAAGRAAGLASARTCDRARALARDLRANLNDVTAARTPDEERLYRAVYALRHTAIAFADDGPLVAIRVQAASRSADRPLSQADDAFLTEVSTTRSPAAADMLQRIADLRERLLNDLKPDQRPLSVRISPRADVGACLADIVAEARQALVASKGGLSLLLDDYATDLKVDGRRVERALEHYSVARAETCQGSASMMRSALRPSTAPRGFDTVIIDEAARANPLDLLIPMAQARRRIILVGDHRQLPHSLEPELESDVDATFAAEEKEALKKSLFERLFEDFQRRERLGEPTRTATLDVQFRMHETLGTFVSEEFYGGRVTSPPSGDRFAHGLPRYRSGGRECVAAWVDVPAREGVREDQEHSGRSKSRPLEVRAIFDLVTEILTHPDYGQPGSDRPKAMVGVISFYAAQVTKLSLALQGVSDYVKVGTVDAFQGTEFPIVILSMTRCTPPVDKQGAEKDRALQRRYGHLMLANRMCVALSRQKRLLIVVGDSQMLRPPDDALRAIGPLKRFNDLCGVRLEFRNNALTAVPPPETAAALAGDEP